MVNEESLPPGWVWFSNPDTKSSMTLDDSGKERVRFFYMRNGNNLYSNIGLDYSSLKLTSIIELCQKKKVNVFLFVPPVFTSFRKHYPDSLEKETFCFLDSISKVNENCFYFNFYNNSLFKKIDFRNADHLSKSGAEKTLKNRE